MPALLLVLALVGSSTAAGAGSGPRIRADVSASPNAAGWFAEPASASLRLVYPGHARVPLCSWSYIELLPTGEGYGALELKRDARLRWCRIEESVDHTAIFDMTLSAEGRRWEVGENVTLRVDLDPPTVSVGDHETVFGGGRISLSGEVADGFSGPLGVTVRLEPRAAAGGVVSQDASCEDCGGPFRRCSLSRDPPCGWSSGWSFQAQVAPGLWTATAVATDVAGNAVESGPIDVLVLP